MKNFDILYFNIIEENKENKNKIYIDLFDIFEDMI